MMRIVETTLTRQNLRAVKRKVRAARFDDGILDFSAVQTVDSSAVALMLSWVRMCQERRQEPRIAGVSNKMIDLMKLYGVYMVLQPYLSEE